MKPARISATNTKRLSLICSLTCFLLCGALTAAGLDVQTAQAQPGQTPTEVLRAPELDAGFHFLYETQV